MNLRDLYNAQARDQRDWNILQDPHHHERARRIIHHATRLLPPNGKLLDVGTGPADIPATIARQRPDAEIHATDIADEWIKEAKHRHGHLPNLHLKRADARHLPYPDNTFHVTTCTEVLEHIPNWTRALHELTRVTQPNGHLIITIPDDPEPDGTYHLHHLTPSTIKKHLPPTATLEHTEEIHDTDPRIPRVWLLTIRMTNRAQTERAPTRAP